MGKGKGVGSSPSSAEAAAIVLLAILHTADSTRGSRH
jgi:hypothetical protein